MSCVINHNLYGHPVKVNYIDQVLFKRLFVYTFDIFVIDKSQILMKFLFFILIFFIAENILSFVLAALVHLNK